VTGGADDRTRERVRGDLQSALALEAGAGTGKTTRLVERVLALLESGVPVSRLVVVTFLREAAEEMRVRLRQELEPRSAGWAQAALAELPGAAIGTIHSFAQRLLSQEALAAGWDSASRVLEEGEAEDLARRHFRHWLEEAVRADPASLVDLRRLGLRIGAADLYALASRLPVGARVPAAPEAPGPGAAAALTAALERALETLDAVRTECADPEDGALAARPLLHDALDELATWQGDDLPFAAAALALPAAGKGNRKNWRSAAALKRLKEDLGAAVEAQRALRQAVGAAVVARLLAWLAPYAAWAAAERAAAAVATFDDLLRRGVALLEADAGARGRVEARYDAVLVDEFQDTDPLQARLLDLVGGAPTDAAAGKVARRFVVGDPKQAIYGFRGADVDTYLAVAATFPPGGRLPLVDNHRALTPLLEVPNRVCAPLMADGSVAYRPLVGGRGETGPAAPPPLQVLRAEASDEENLDASAVRAREAELVARHLRGALDAPWRIEGRALAPGDIAILFASRTAYPEYMEALTRYRLPFRAEREKNLWQRRIPRDLGRILLALARPDDRLAVTSALRTSLIGVSDQALWQHVRGSGRLSLRAPGGPHADPILERALLALAAAAAPTAGRPSERLLALIETLDLAAAAALDDGAAGVTELGRALESVRLLEGTESGGEALARVAAALADVGYERGQGDLPVPAPAAEPSPPGGEIRLMTVHEAKGNEFGVIVLGDGWGEPPSVGEKLLIGARDRTVDLRLAAPLSWGRGAHVGTARAEARHLEEKAAERAEQVRLLYVALTRARDVLVVPDAPPPRSRAGGRSTNRLIARAAGYETPVRALDALSALGLAPARVVPDAALPAPGEAVAAEVLAAPAEDLLDLRRRLGARSAAVPIVRPSGVEAAAPVSPPADDTAPHARALRADTARRVGTAVHGVLALALEGAGRPWRGQVARVARAAGLEERAADEVEALAARALAHPLVARAARAPRRALEVAVSARLADGGLVVGRADLVFADEGGTVIVDFKTDRLAVRRGAAATAVAQRGYDGQLRLYAQALAHASGLVVAEAYVLFVRSGDSVAVALDAGRPDAAARRKA
jgi:ATP-dependent helicase/nuclease subunit A